MSRAITVLLIVGSTLAAACAPQAAREYAGSEACSHCHANEYRRWLGSDHQRAMAEATPQSVNAVFSGIMTHLGDTTELFRQGGHWYENAQGPDGRHADYPVAYTFGVHPLQQYLTRFPRGRLQVLPAAYDTRPEAQGGQRWFHLYPDDTIPPGDELHWTGRAQNWNHMCAECHVTGYRKGYVAATDSFDTRWSELGVGCEACHGPGAEHVRQAELASRGGQPGGRWTDSTSFGLRVTFRERRGVAWRWDSTAHHPARSVAPGAFRTEVETCARCHSRRSAMTDDYRPGKPLLDTHRPDLLMAPMYFPDGRIREEVYEYGSFLQSRMYARGVTCSDCHDPHDQHLRAGGNGVCLQCHLASRFDAPAHTKLRRGAPGSACVDCHMPPRTYMVVDVRRDHSLRIPADTTARRHAGPSARPDVAAAFTLAEQGSPAAESALVSIARADVAPIVRATALAYLARYAFSSLDVIHAGLVAPEPIVRFGALQALDGFEPLARLSLAVPLLSDSLRVIRMEAAELLAGVPAARLAPAERSALQAALAEYRAAQRFNGDQPWAHLNLGLVDIEQGDAAGADSAYRTALRLDSTFVPAYVNLADLYREQGRDSDGEPLLRRAAALAPNNPDVHYALGLLLVRARRYEEAERELAASAALAPGDRRYAEALAALRAGR